MHRNRDALTLAVSSPHRNVVLLFGPKSHAYPRITVFRKTERPERKCLTDIPADFFIVSDRFFYQFRTLLADVHKMAALVDAQKQCVYHVEDNLLAVSLRQRIRPDRRLLRCQRHRRIRRDRRIAHVIFLIACRLNTVAAEHRIIHPQTTA